jgi:hypothetical protein
VWTVNRVIAVESLKGSLVRAAQVLKRVEQRAHLAITAALVTFAIVGIVVGARAYGMPWTHQNGDPWNYLAAGERLNADHDLYSLQPGDRDVALRPPYWSIPLLAPPPIAVVWRPLALLGEPAMVIWGLGCLAAVLASVVFLLKHHRLAGLALIALPLTLTTMAGNFSALLLAILLGAWIYRDRPMVVGSLIAIGLAVKLTPIVFVGWLAFTGRWRAVAATIGACIVIVLLSLVGAGSDSFLDWIKSVPSSAPSPLAISSQTGLPPLVVAGLLGLPVLISFKSDVWGFRLAAVAAALATPALYFQALAVLAATLVPRDRLR